MGRATPRARPRPPRRCGARPTWARAAGRRCRRRAGPGRAARGVPGLGWLPGRGTRRGSTIRLEGGSPGPVLRSIAAPGPMYRRGGGGRSELPRESGDSESKSDPDIRKSRGRGRGVISYTYNSSPPRSAPRHPPPSTRARAERRVSATGAHRSVPRAPSTQRTKYSGYLIT